MLNKYLERDSACHLILKVNVQIVLFHLFIHLLTFQNNFPVLMNLFIYLQREKNGGEWERNIHWFSLVHVLSWDQTCNPGMCPDLGTNRQPFTCRMRPSLLSHTSQGFFLLIIRNVQQLTRLPQTPVLTYCYKFSHTPQMTKGREFLEKMKYSRTSNINFQIL